MPFNVPTSGGMEPFPVQCYAPSSNLRRGVYARGGKGYGPRIIVRVGDRSLLHWAGYRTSAQPHHRQRPMVRCGGHRGVEPDMADAVASTADEAATARRLSRRSLTPPVGPICGDAVYFDSMANPILPVERALPEAGRSRRRHPGAGGESAFEGEFAGPGFRE